MLLSLTDFFLVALTVTCLASAIVVIGYLARTARIENAWRLTFIIGAVLAGWLAITGVLANTGVLSTEAIGPPRVPFVALTAIFGLVLASRSTFIRGVIEATPLWVPVAAQTFRILVEIALWLYWREGTAPVQVTFEGWNFDVLAGITAPLMSLAIANERVGPRWVVLWNMIGIATLGSAVFSVVTSAPGPMRLDWPNEPFVAIATWPLVLIPSLLAPAALVLHIISIQQCMTRKEPKSEAVIALRQTDGT